MIISFIKTIALDKLAMAMVIFLFLFRTLTSFRNPGDKMTAIEIITGFPTNISIENGVEKALYLRDTITIFYIGNFIVYRLNGTPDVDSKGGEMLIESGKAIPGINPFFIYKKDSSYGWFISTANVRHGSEHISVQDFLEKQARTPITLEPPDESVLKTQTIRGSDGNTLEERYISKIKKSETTFDSLYLYFDKSMVNVNYTFSPKWTAFTTLNFVK